MPSNSGNGIGKPLINRFADARPEADHDQHYGQGYCGLFRKEATPKARHGNYQKKLPVRFDKAKIRQDRTNIEERIERFRRKRRIVRGDGVYRVRSEKK